MSTNICLRSPIHIGSDGLTSSSYSLSDRSQFLLACLSFNLNKTEIPYLHLTTIAMLTERDISLIVPAPSVIGYALDPIQCPLRKLNPFPKHEDLLCLDAVGCIIVFVFLLS